LVWIQQNAFSAREELSQVLYDTQGMQLVVSNISTYHAYVEGYFIGIHSSLLLSPQGTTAILADRT
jgi:hypothetical protein